MLMFHLCKLILPLSVVSIGFEFTNYSEYEGLLAKACAIILNGTVERPVSVFASTSQITAIRES